MSKQQTIPTVSLSACGSAANCCWCEFSEGEGEFFFSLRMDQADSDCSFADCFPHACTMRSAGMRNRDSSISNRLRRLQEGVRKARVRLRRKMLEPARWLRESALETSAVVLVRVKPTPNVERSPARAKLRSGRHETEQKIHLAPGRRSLWQPSPWRR